MRVIAVLICCLVLSSSAWATHAKAPAMIQVEGARVRPFALAFPKIGWESTANQLWEIVKNDLELSMVFSILDPKSYVDSPTFKWQQTGAEGLARIKLTRVGLNMVANLSLRFVGLSVPEQKYELQINDAQVRDVAHRMADMIYHYFTGQKGYFSAKIVAVKQVGSHKTIVSMDVDAQQEYTLVNNGFINILPSLSPDGKTLLYTGYAAGNPDLYRLDLTDRSTRKISSFPGLNVGGVFSPDGNRIALTLSKDGNSEIYTMGREGGQLERLTNSLAIDTSPSFSPDGKQLAFVSTRGGNPHIYLMNRDGSGVRRLTFQGKYNQIPRFSPKGDSIAFVARDEFNVFDIFIVDVKSGKLSRVTQDQASNSDPFFSPNGQSILFVSTRNGGSDLYVANLDGSIQKRLTFSGKYETPFWSGSAR